MTSSDKLAVIGIIVLVTFYTLTILIGVYS